MGDAMPRETTGVGNCAFVDCISLKSVIIPDSVTSIGNRVFAECGALIRVTIPGSVTSISVNAFTECEELVLSVTEGSYAELCAKENGILYVYVAELKQQGSIRQEGRLRRIFCT